MSTLLHARLGYSSSTLAVAAARKSPKRKPAQHLTTACATGKHSECRSAHCICQECRCKFNPRWV